MTRKWSGIFVLVFIILLTASEARAGFLEADLGINGLTCSQCSRSVEMQLRKLPFIERISMNLEQTKAKIYFKKDAKVDMGRIAKAVKDAGFSVRYLKGEMNFDGVQLTDSRCFQYKGDAYKLLMPLPVGASQVTLVFKGKEYNAKPDAGEMKELSPAVCKGKKTYYVAVQAS